MKPKTLINLAKLEAQLQTALDHPNGRSGQGYKLLRAAAKQALLLVKQEQGRLPKEATSGGSE